MGTTLTLAFVSGRRLFMVHCGDSRGYLFAAVTPATDETYGSGQVGDQRVISQAKPAHTRTGNVLTNVPWRDEGGR